MANAGDIVTESEENAFEQRMMQILNNGVISLGISIGSASGLFETMAELDEPRSSSEIAEAACLKERYVREWLGAMVTSNIVEVDPDRNTYFLPLHRAKSLSRKKGDGSVATFSDGVPLLTGVFQDILDCMKKDGPKGVSYSRYPTYTKYSDEMASLKLQKLPQGYLFTSEEVQSKLVPGAVACDVGCGSGIPVCTLAQLYPACKFYGVDLSEKAITAAQNRALEMKLTNVTFIQCDASSMAEDWIEKFDIVVTMAVVHDLPRPDLVHHEIMRILKDDGIYIMEDIDCHSNHSDNIGNPRAALYYTWSMFRCMATSLYFDNSFGLGAMWGKERAIEFLEKMGLECFSSYSLDNVSRIVYLSKKKMLAD
ncbi:S-adenosylmethionine-dependent methyltransferase Rv2258c-like [Saccoglossus kowalevskii]|uniref:Uncharacterized protein LOC100370288 n=1 Tax=Saccoglossus kowalevskii TaxID=10224 RepID=A0ABM0GZL3_SACKO|nr:PREDICTED: uncharacterized protein LOC100370288 [Saccoglossus kowalevskii]